MSFHIDRLLYATDLSAHSPTVFRHALSLAEKYRAAIYILHVVEDPEILKNNVAERYTSTSVLQSYRDQAIQDALDTIKARLETFSASAINSEEIWHAHVKDINVEIGRPARVILSEADRLDVQCIVLGTRRQSGLGQMVLGSVARKITRRTRRPLFLFPV